ncbi:MAG: ACT domain-containing protein [Pseudomonadota bacterium]
MADDKVGIFVISTYDTDYILVKEPKAAARAWQRDGHIVD